MTQISRQLFVADSNGDPVTLAGDYTMNPNNVVCAPHFTQSKYCRGTWFHVDRVSNGQMYVVFYKGAQPVSDPVLLYPGVLLNIDADTITPVGVRRGGELWLNFGMGTPPYYTSADIRAGFRNIQFDCTPTTQIALTPGGPLSNIWCHPDSAPGSTTPLVTGVAAWPSAGVPLSTAGHTPANWAFVNLCVFSVDPRTQNVFNIRRITTGSLAVASAVATDINPWDRLGLLAIPSAANPNPALAPATSVKFLGDCFGVYSRTAEIGYLTAGNGAEL